MSRPSPDEATRLLYGALMLAQEKWVLFIVHSLLNGPMRFNDLSRAAVGVNKKTLTERLERLEGLGIVRKTVLSLQPPHTRYELTEAGQALRDVIDALGRWGAAYPEHLPAMREETC